VSVDAEFQAHEVEAVDGSRCYARSEDADLLARAEHEELVGLPLTLITDDAGVNRARER